MYQQPPGVNHSSDSLRRLSSNNPFRQYIAPQHSNPSSGSIRTSNAAFEEWVEKNKKFIDEESDEEISGENIVNFYGAPSPMTEEFARPQFPTRIQRTGSDSSVSYSPVERYV